MATATKANAKKAVKKAAPAKKVAAKAPAKKAAPKKVAKKVAKPAKKAPVKKAPAASKSGAGSKSGAKTSSAAAAKKAPAKKAPAKKAPVKKAQTKKAAPVKAAKPAKVQKPAKPVKVVEPKVVVPPAPPVQVINPIGGVVPTIKKAVPGKKAAPKHPVEIEDESNWTKTELNQVRKLLDKQKAELEAEIAEEEHKFHRLIVESGEGAGDDQADAGTKTFEREQEISILSNKKDMLDQIFHALERIAQGTYGRCEDCGRPIGKHRLLEANPRATLCMSCREREDRS